MAVVTKSLHSAKGLLPYHGLGSGIKRALEQWPQIDFVDDRDGCLFTVTVHRRPIEEPDFPGITSKTPVKTPVKTTVKTTDLIFQLLQENPKMTLAEAAESIGKSLSAVERACSSLVKSGRLKYVGPKKGGHWEVIQ
jgi:ATP-dependent DNA helicase RecG